MASDHATDRSAPAAPIGTPPKPERYPTRIMRLRAVLGRCSLCWHRSTTIATVSSRGASDEVLGSFDLQLCGTHVTETFKAMTSVPHKGVATLKNGRQVPWERPEGDPT